MIDFVKTNIQKKAMALIVGACKYIMLFGGSRSGKTFTIIYTLVIRAIKTKSRHLIVRQHFNHVKTSIWLDTLPKVLHICFSNLVVKWNKTDYYIKLANGSEIWIAGLDNGDRVEKILGKEYSSVFFNECSQIDYSSVQVVLTRLAEKNSLVKKAYFDENPPSKRHWSYWLFIKKLDPIDDTPLDEPDLYGSILMNPKDNLENIDPEYLKILNRMPEKQRKRFLDGEFDDESDGNAYYSFDRDTHVTDLQKMPGTLFAGLDFNVDPMTCVIIQLINNKIHVIDEIFLNNSDTYKMAAEIKKKGYTGARLIPDSTGSNRKTSGQSDFDILKQAGFVIESTHNPFVTDRVNNVNRLFANNEILIDNKCKKLIADLEKVVWKDNKLDQKTDKHLTHISDALGYACYKLKPFRQLNLKPYQGKR